MSSPVCGDGSIYLKWLLIGLCGYGIYLILNIDTHSFWYNPWICQGLCGHMLKLICTDVSVDWWPPYVLLAYTVDSFNIGGLFIGGHLSMTMALKSWQLQSVALPNPLKMASCIESNWQCSSWVTSTSESVVCAMQMQYSWWCDPI